MSQHPNVVLKLTIKAEGTTRRLLRDLLAKNRDEVPDKDLPFRLDAHGDVLKHAKTGANLRVCREDDELCIGGECYNTCVMEDTYDEDNQISGEEGDLIVFDQVTYGYGEDISWPDLCSRVDALVAWASQHHLEHAVSVSSNYW